MKFALPILAAYSVPVTCAIFAGLGMLHGSKGWGIFLAISIVAFFFAPEVSVKSEKHK